MRDIKTIYTPLTKKAIKICFEVHAGQVDKSGLTYALHPLHLAEQMDDEDSTIDEILKRQTLKRLK